jgi:hypothetical protein
MANTGSSRCHGDQTIRALKESFSRTVQGIDIPEGKWENEQDVIDRLWERMEWFLLKVMPREYEELPDTILTILLGGEFEERDGTWYEPNMAQDAEGGKWGLGKVVKERRDKAGMTPIEVLMKLHKTPVLLQ